MGGEERRQWNEENVGFSLRPICVWKLPLASTPLFASVSLSVIALQDCCYWMKSAWLTARYWTDGRCNEYTTLLPVLNLPRNLLNTVKWAWAYHCPPRHEHCCHWLRVGPSYSSASHAFCLEQLLPDTISSGKCAWSCGTGLGDWVLPEALGSLLWLPLTDSLLVVCLLWGQRFALFWQ